MLPAGSLWLLFGNHNLIDKLIINQCWKNKNKIRYMQYYKVVFLEILWEVSTYFSVKEAYLLLELYDRCFNSCLVSGDTCMIISVGWYINQQFLKFLNHISSCYNLKLKTAQIIFPVKIDNADLIFLKITWLISTKLCTCDCWEIGT